MSAVVFRDEIEKPHIGRLHRSPDGRKAWVTDRTRRKSGNAVSIIRARIRQILARQIAIEILYPVDNRWIALERHVKFQPIVEHGRNQWTLGFDTRLLLDDRGESENFMGC